MLSTSTMFQTEMEDLGFGLSLAPSDLLFADDLLNVPVDYFEQHGAETTKVEEEEDLLGKIMQEVQIDVHSDNDLAMYNDDHLPNSPSGSTESSSDETRTLIDEVENFLIYHEKQTQQTECNDKMEDTEEFLDALLNESNNSFNSNVKISNISQVITEDGENVVIVITEDEESKRENAANSPSSPGDQSPRSSFSVEVESDLDWSPGSITCSPASTPKRNRGPYKRGPYKIKASSHSLRDKKERKKMQNVVAARRYRDKKKNEQSHVEVEEKDLLQRNLELKRQLQEVDNEYNTLKKLMVELGLIKVAK